VRGIASVALALLGALLGACSSSGGGPLKTPDAGAHPSPGVCFPDPTQTGNALNVGAYCTAGGDQCAQYDNAKICAIDVDSEGGKFCIKIGCKTHSDCGDQACCTGRSDNPIHACVPLGCLIDDAGGGCPAIPGMEDAGTTVDSGPQDR
jgi:hypothetical protein